MSGLYVCMDGSQFCIIKSMTINDLYMYILAFGTLYVDLLCRNIQYIERDSKEHFHTMRAHPETLTKKVVLLRYFRNYMNEHLVKVSSDCSQLLYSQSKGIYCEVFLVVHLLIKCY